MNTVLLLQVFSCFFMTGVIWLVQLLVYPNFRLIDPAQFHTFHRFHSNRIAWIVAPIMGIELITGIWLWTYRTGEVYLWNFLLVLITWILTGVVSVPIHRHLENMPQDQKDLLIYTNWPRTLTWTLRSSLLFWILSKQSLIDF